MVNAKSKNTDKSLPDYPAGIQVTLEIESQMCEGTFSHWTRDNLAYIKVPGRIPVWRKPGKFNVLSQDASAVRQVYNEAAGENTNNIMQTSPVKTFDVNKRYAFMESLIRMTLRGEQSSLIIGGEGGISKTFGVLDECKKMKLRKLGVPVRPDKDNEGEEDAEYSHKVDEDTYDFVHIKGYSTPKGIYRQLYEHATKTLIFDDCDSALMNEVAVNLLATALDSYDQRIVSWLSEAPLTDLPQQFEFFGKVIFITNKKRHQLPQKMQSRSTVIDMTLTADEKIERMKSILPNLRKDLSMELKGQCLDLLNTHRHYAKDLNTRTLLKVLNIMTSKEPNKEELAEYTILG